MSTAKPTSEAVILVRDLRNRFGTHVVHENLDLDVYRGETLGLVGGSGTGKSVFLDEQPQGWTRSGPLPLTI